jgi:hypothetical protein
MGGDFKALLYQLVIVLQARIFFISMNSLSDSVMYSVFVSKTVDHGFELRSGQTKDYEIDMCCFSAKHAPLRRKSKYLLTRNQDNVSRCGDMSIRGLLFQ